MHQQVARQRGEIAERVGVVACEPAQDLGRVVRVMGDTVAGKPQLSGDALRVRGFLVVRAERIVEELDVGPTQRRRSRGEQARVHAAAEKQHGMLRHSLDDAVQHVPDAGFG